MQDFLRQLPKAELHLHIEGTLEPELMMALAARNGVPLPYASVEEVRRAYDFADLSAFLELYFLGMSVLRHEADFEDLAMDYLRRAHAEGVVHVEMHVDPQAHLARGVSLEAVLNGLERARERAARELDISTALILAFLRDKPVEEAMQLLEAVEPYRERFAAVGLDSAEMGHPPGRFAEVFRCARQMGLACVAHAGEEGPPEYIHEALEQLQVCRVDHGVRCLEDPALVETLRERGIVLTVCPLSNVSLKVVERLAEHPLPRLLDAGLRLTLSSDDPAYFGGGMLDNFMACREAFGWGEATFRQLAANAIDEAFMSEARRAELQARLADG